MCYVVLACDNVIVSISQDLYCAEHTTCQAQITEVHCLQATSVVDCCIPDYAALPRIAYSQCLHVNCLVLELFELCSFPYFMRPLLPPFCTYFYHSVSIHTLWLSFTACSFLSCAALSFCASFTLPPLPCTIELCSSSSVHDSLCEISWELFSFSCSVWFLCHFMVDCQVTWLVFSLVALVVIGWWIIVLG